VHYLSKNIRWVFPLCFGIAGLILAGILLYFCGHSSTQAWLEGGAFWLTGAITGNLTIWVIGAYPTRVGLIGYAIVIGLLAAVAGAFTNDFLLGLCAQDDARYQLFLDHTFAHRLFIAFGLLLPVAVVTAANIRIADLEERFLRQANAESLLREAELFKLRQQLQPHFLYNSLNAINALILIDPDKAQEMIGRLSDFLRTSVRKDSNELQTVAAELAYLDAYLAIETVRFGDRLEVICQKDYTDDARLPPFLLQPLIENAIKFGLNGQAGAVRIQLNIILDNRMLTVSITNPFDPLMTPPKGTGFGLEGVRRRLYLLYGREDLVQTSAEKQQFTTTLKIPQLHVQSIAD
jgi:hypothetical protein